MPDNIDILTRHTSVCFDAAYSTIMRLLLLPRHTLRYEVTIGITLSRHVRGYDAAFVGAAD